MKHITLSLLVLGLATFFACSKQQAPLNPSNPSTETTNNTTKVSGAVKKEKDPPHWHRAHLSTLCMFCCGWKGNCIVIDKDIIVRPHVARTIFSVSDSDNSDGVGSVFRSSDLQTFCDYFVESDVAEKLKSGLYYIKMHSGDGKTACYAAGTVYPVTLENMEFAFEFDHE